MGSRPKIPKLPPPPPPPIDEADRAPIDAALAKKSAMSLVGYKKTFLQPRGPGSSAPAPQPDEPILAPPRAANPRGTPTYDPNAPRDPRTGYPTAPAPEAVRTPTKLADLPTTRKILNLMGR